MRTPKIVTDAQRNKTKPGLIPLNPRNTYVRIYTFSIQIYSSRASRLCLMIPPRREAVNSKHYYRTGTAKSYAFAPSSPPPPAPNPFLPAQRSTHTHAKTRGAHNINTPPRPKTKLKGMHACSNESNVVLSSRNSTETTKWASTLHPPPLPPSTPSRPPNSLSASTPTHEGRADQRKGEKVQEPPGAPVEKINTRRTGGRGKPQEACHAHKAPGSQRCPPSPL